MLVRGSRLTTGRDFSETIRHGHRAGSRTLVVHLAVGPEPEAATEQGTPRAGLVVARSVGAAVTRNRVQRRLRHLVREPLAALPPSSRLVVRALPASATASSQDLDRDLRGALDKVLRKTQVRAQIGALGRRGVRS